MNLGIAALALLVLGCTHANAAGASQGHKVVTLSLPRAVESNDLIRAHITVGPLPRGARLIARLPSGDVAGVVSPYGTANRGGGYTIPVPRRAIRDGKVTLHLEFQEKRGAASRAPTDDELRKVELFLVPSR